MSVFDNCVHYYKLDESSGNAVDIIGGLNLTNTSATYAAGKINNGVVFNGSANLSSGSNIGISGISARSMNIWIKVANGHAGNAGCGWGAASANNAFEIYITTTFNFGGYGNDKDFGVTINDGNWHMATVTMDTSGNIACYTDGANKVTAAKPTLFTTDSTLRVGGNLFGLSDVVGMMDEFGVWNVQLADADVATLWNSGNGLTPANNFSRTLSDLMGYAASRTVTIDRTGTFARTVSDSVMNAASRLAVLGKGFFRNISEGIMNAKSRFVSLDFIKMLHTTWTEKVVTSTFWRWLTNGQ